MSDIYQIKIWENRCDRDEGFSSIEESGDNLDELIITATDLFNNKYPAVEVETVKENTLLFHISEDEDNDYDTYIEDNR